MLDALVTVRPHGMKIKARAGENLNCVNDLLEKASQKASIDKKHIYEIAVAANTTMTHLFLSVNPESIGYVPRTFHIGGV